MEKNAANLLTARFSHYECKNIVVFVCVCLCVLLVKFLTSSIFSAIVLNLMSKNVSVGRWILRVLRLNYTFWTGIERRNRWLRLYLENAWESQARILVTVVNVNWMSRISVNNNCNNTPIKNLHTLCLIYLWRTSNNNNNDKKEKRNTHTQRKRRSIRTRKRIHRTTNNKSDSMDYWKDHTRNNYIWKISKKHFIRILTKTFISHLKSFVFISL